MKARVLLLFFVLTIFSCNQVNDLNPVDPDAEPTAAVQVVKNRYPEAKELVFKTIMSSRVWEVAFNSGRDKYTSLVNQTEMSETFRANPDSVPELLTHLLAGSPFDGGTFSDNAEDVDFYKAVERRNRLVYNFQGLDFNFEWRRYQGTNYRPTNAFFEQNKYRIKLEKLADFPKEIRDYLETKKELTFYYGEVRVRLNYEKQFWMQVLFNRNNKDEIGTLLFDEQGNLKWMSREFNQPAVYKPESNIATLPEPIQRHLDQSPDLKDFQYKSPEYDKWRGEYDGISSYYLKLTKNDHAQVCELYFDGDGNLLNKRYFISF